MMKKKWVANCGGGATFYLADSRTGEGIIIEADSESEAMKIAEEMAESGDYEWLLSDDPEPDYAEFSVSECGEIEKEKQG